MTRQIAKYGAVFRVNLQQQMAYRGEALWRSVSMIVFMLIFAALWTTAFSVSGRSMLAGFTLSDMIWYLAMTESIALSRARAFVQISEEVKNGDLAYALCKPYQYVGFQIMNALGEVAVRWVINFVVGVAVVLLLTRQIPATPASFLAYALIAALALILDTCISVLIGLLAFSLEEVRPVDWIYQKLMFTIGGLFLPLDVFPEPLRSIALALPFRLIMYSPARAFVHLDIATWAVDVVTLALYIGLAFLALRLLFAWGTRRLSVQGG